MKPKRSALALAAALIALAAQAHGGPAQAPAKPDPELRAAFKAAFGPHATRRVQQAGWGDVTLVYKPERIVRLGDTLVLISKAANTDACHGCSGGFAVHYLQHAGRDLKVVGAWPELVDGSSLGEPPTIEVRDDLFQGPGVVARTGWTGQGCTVEYADLVELTPTRPIVRARKVLLTYSLEEEQSSDVHDVSGEFRPGPHRGQGFTVAYSGDRTLALRFTPGKGDAYGVTGPVGRVPGC